MEDQPQTPLQQPPMTPSTLLYILTPDTRNRASDLFDAHELRALVSRLRQGLSTPGWRSSKTSGRRGSTLYDSQELTAVVKQLDETVRAARSSMPPFAEARCLCKRSKKPKRIAGPDEPLHSGLLLKLWKKVKWSILGSQ